MPPDVRHLALTCDQLPWPYVIDDARSYIDGAIQRSSEGAEESYAVTLHADVVGTIGLEGRWASRPRVYERYSAPTLPQWRTPSRS
jgi:hypothetical protein